MVASPESTHEVIVAQICLYPVTIQASLDSMTCPQKVFSVPMKAFSKPSQPFSSTEPIPLAISSCPVIIPMRKTAPKPIAVAAAAAPATAFGRTARTLNARTTARAAVMILFFIPIFLSR